jgi:hypothetical protein
MTDIRSFVMADCYCNTYHWLVVEDLWERLPLSNRQTQRFHKYTFNPEKVNDLDLRRINRSKFETGLQLSKTPCQRRHQKGRGNITENIETSTTRISLSVQVKAI